MDRRDEPNLYLGNGKPLFRKKVEQAPVPKPMPAQKLAEEEDDDEIPF